MSVEEIITKKLKKYARLQEEHHPKEEEAGTCDMECCISSIRQNLSALKKNEVNTSDRYIGLEAGIRGKLNWIKKKVVRRLSFFYVQPICDQQTIYNTAATQCVEKLLELQIELSSKMTRLQAKEQKMQEELQTEKQQMQEELQKEKQQIWEELQIEKQQMQEKLQTESQRMEDALRIGQQYSLETQKELVAVYAKLEQYLENMKIIESTGICSLLSSANNKMVTSYAQSGEDAIIFYLLPHLQVEMQNATYLDLGANHAKELSNTYALYEKGVRGVLVEANPALIPELKLNRNEDIIINKCLALRSGQPVTFYVLSGDGLSTPDRSAACKMMAENPAITIVQEVDVETVTIQEVLNQYFSEAPTFLNIDVEGMELDILQGIDFSKVRPKVVIVEMIEYSMMLNAGNRNQQILEFMKKKDYIEYAFTGINSIFVDASVWKYTDQ
ncbi:MAG: FkbM family methyltransferase [Eubacterium sp.]|nr:FkbM family methyltransferase [Eubacterium sp.]